MYSNPGSERLTVKILKGKPPQHKIGLRARSDREGIGSVVCGEHRRRPLSLLSAQPPSVLRRERVAGTHTTASAARAAFLPCWARARRPGDVRPPVGPKNESNPTWCSKRRRVAYTDFESGVDDNFLSTVVTGESSPTGCQRKCRAWRSAPSGTTGPSFAPSA